MSTVVSITSSVVVDAPEKNSEEFSVQTNKTVFKFYRADTEKLQKAIDSTGKSRAAICSSGGLNSATLKNALEGKRVIAAKANAICNGLNMSGCSPKAERDDLFPHGENPPVKKKTIII